MKLLPPPRKKTAKVNVLTLGQKDFYLDPDATYCMYFTGESSSNFLWGTGDELAEYIPKLDYLMWMDTTGSSAAYRQIPDSAKRGLWTLEIQTTQPITLD